MKKIKLITILALGILLASCQKEILKPENDEGVERNLDISFVINPLNDYSLPIYNNEEVAITLGIRKYNTKTLKTEVLYDTLFNKTQLKNYTAPIEIKKKVKYIKNVENITYSVSQSYNGINNTNLRAEAYYDYIQPFDNFKIVTINL